MKSTTVVQKLKEDEEIEESLDTRKKMLKSLKESKKS
jgi:hypothetical protein